MLCGYMHETDSSCIIRMPQLKVAQPTTYGMGKKKSASKWVHRNCQMTSFLLNQAQFYLRVKGILVFIVTVRDVYYLQQLHFPDSWS